MQKNTNFFILIVDYGLYFGNQAEKMTQRQKTL